MRTVPHYKSSALINNSGMFWLNSPLHVMSQVAKGSVLKLSFNLLLTFLCAL